MSWGMSEDLIQDSHKEQILYLTDLRERDHNLDLPLLVNFMGPPRRLLVFCGSIPDSFRVVDTFSADLRPRAITLGADSFYFKSDDQDAVAAIESGELARRFKEG